MDITEFIAARLAEDEAAANAGARRVGMPWHAEPQPGTPGGLVTDDLGLVASTGGLYAADHVARHDPARVLREVEAKRAHLGQWTDARAQVVECGRTGDDTGRSRWEAVALALTHVVVSDAAVWGDHPDYRAEWKP